jgi:glyoxylase-like metal-dependent hydrolase (beta-lactamase superfamily II)
MKAEPVTFYLGDTAVTIFTIAHLMADMAEWYQLSAGDVVDEVRPFLERPLPLPVQSILIRHGDILLLIDAPKYDIPDDSPYAIPGYVPPPGLVEQWTQIGVTSDDVTHVVITHPHFDHFNGLIAAEDEPVKLLCPQARHYLALADWEMPEMIDELANPDSLGSKTFGFLQQQGMLELVNGPLDLGEGIRILPAPGETPGHQIVRVEAGGKVLYCVGDLFHHELELRLPGTAVHWADLDAMVKSQQQLIEAALTEDALLVACHIAGYGRIARADDGLIWQKV